ncbi:MAG: GNAT family N-acetyltransferase [Rhodospirillaceae bacterium]
MEHSIRTATIRTANRADLSAIISLLADDMFGATRDKPGTTIDRDYERAFAAIDQDPNHQIAVMESEGRIIGCMQLSYIPGLSFKGMWRGQIESVRIASDLRGKGLGHQFFEWAIMECRKRGCGLVQLTTNALRADAQRFYASLGFQPTHAGMKLKL